MEDMKKLVERYKRELMEYSRQSPQPGKLSFPEMLPEERPARETAQPATTEAAKPAQTAQTAQPAPPEPNILTDTNYQPASAPEPPKPRIIGYSDDQRALDDLSKYFSGLMAPGEDGAGTPSGAAPDSVQSPDSADTANITDNDDFNTLPPQFTEDAPQYDLTNNAVSPENNNQTSATEPEQPSQFPRSGENTAAEPGTIENIGTLPVSGQSPDEQLGRRTFVNQQGPVNSPDDIKPLVQQENDRYPKQPPEPDYASLEDFLAVNTRQGTLRFRTYTARNALPVPNANIIVFKIIGGKPHTFYTLVTDSSGQTEIVPLPAPSSTLSQTPDSGIQPYSLYDASIEAAGYLPVTIKNLPIFEGILSVQRTALVPGANEPENITETEPDLTEVSDA